MQTMPPPSAGRVIFRQGLFFGVLLGIVHSGLSLVNQALAQSGLSTLGLLVIVLLWLGVFFWAGVRSAKQTGRVGVGSLTGLVTAVFAGIIAFIALMVIAAIQISTPSSSYQQIFDYYSSRGIHITYSAIFGVLALCGTILLLLGIGMGAGIGALGGLLGRSQSTVLPPMNPGYPPPYGYGQPPMQPQYPPPPYAPSYQPPYGQPYQNQPPQWPNQPPDE
jgi:hypothetical protein